MIGSIVFLTKISPLPNYIIYILLYLFYFCSFVPYIIYHCFDFFSVFAKVAAAFFRSVSDYRSAILAILLISSFPET